jgi:hypothetical protein
MQRIKVAGSACAHQNLEIGVVGESGAHDC